MSESEYEAWRREQEAHLDKDARHHARVAHMSNTDFERYKREEISRCEAAKARADKSPPPEATPEGKLTDDELRETWRSYGVNVDANFKPQRNFTDFGKGGGDAE